MTAPSSSQFAIDTAYNDAIKAMFGSLVQNLAGGTGIDEATAKFKVGVNIAKQAYDIATNVLSQ